MGGTKYGRQGKNVIMIFIENNIPDYFLIGRHPLRPVLGGVRIWPLTLGDGLQTEIVRNFDFEISVAPIMNKNFKNIL